MYVLKVKIKTCVVLRLSETSCYFKTFLPTCVTNVIKLTTTFHSETRFLPSLVAFVIQPNFSAVGFSHFLN